MISGMRRIFFVIILKNVSSISMFYPSKLAFSNFIQLEKWSVECGASSLLLYWKMYPVFLCFTLRNWRSVISFKWKNDQWNAAHLFWFYGQKLSRVFLCFTFRNWRSVISFNWKNDQWNAAHLFCFIFKNSLQYFYVVPIEIGVL